MPRLFVALELPESVKDRLESLCHGVQGARWTRDGQFHVTLAFIGEVEGPVARAVGTALSAVRSDPFELAVAGVGHFPPRGTPKVLWAGLDPTDALHELHARVVSQLRRAGLDLERRRYAPHVTLARLARPSARDVMGFLGQHALLRDEPFPVTDFQLFRSVLGRSGAVHRVEASYPLERPRGGG